jgi:hypothetical protein
MSFCPEIENTKTCYSHYWNIGLWFRSYHISPSRPPSYSRVRANRWILWGWLEWFWSGTFDFSFSNTANANCSQMTVEADKNKPEQTGDSRSRRWFKPAWYCSNLEPSSSKSTPGYLETLLTT